MAGRLLTILLFGCGCSLLQAGWETWEGCRLAANPSNDGDSFEINHRGHRYIIRLYFVDAPETDDTNTGGVHRVAEQAAHFGKSEAEVVHAGKTAARFTQRLLSRPFTVLTAREDARGNSALGRIYGFVTTADGDDLGRELLRNGLARSYGMPAAPPGRSENALRRTYDTLEQRARRHRVGVYSPAPLRSIVLANGNEEKGDDNPREERVQLARMEKSPSPFPSQINPGAKDASHIVINVNHATREELESLPGIGSVLAERIIDGRPYQNQSDLLRVSGIGPATLERISLHISTEQP